jgi:hypothetical protein
MTGRKKSDRSALDRLADALVEDILSASDGELMSEVGRGDVDGAAAARAAFNRAAATSGKRRLASAKTGGHGLRQLPPNFRTLDPKTARLRLDELIARHPETASKLTPASHKGEKLSDEDVYGMLERFQERRVLEQRGGEHDGR